MLNNLENIQCGNKIFNVDELKVDELKNVINLKSKYLDVFNSSISDDSNEIKEIKNSIVKIEQSLGSFIGMLKVAKDLKEEGDFIKNNPKYFKIMAFAKSAFSLAIIGAGILGGTAAVVFLGPSGSLLAIAIGLATWFISSSIGALYEYQGGVHNVMAAEMGIMVLGPIAPLIPFWTYFCREKQISIHLKKFENEKNIFVKMINQHVDLTNQCCPKIQAKLIQEINERTKRQKSPLEDNSNLDEQITLTREINYKLQLLNFLQTYHSSLNELMKSEI